ncbi:hypothetical protein [Streptomyces sp. NPDC059874]|uniref:hypothetical protein n=1 Tax=Streptomyces sp. NPDC059874 TaxID=3346983 RepID=UPI00366020A6
MPSITTLTPAAGQIDSAGLLVCDAESLAACAVRRSEPWWRRLACVRALAGRVPATRLDDLLACVRDGDDTGSVRVALLEVLSDHEELLPWLRHEDRRAESAYGMTEAVLTARGRLGDLMAAAGLAELAFSHWPRSRESGDAGLDALVARHGAAAVLDGLDESRPETRALRVRLRHRAGEDVLDALADPDAAVGHLAQELLTDPARLRGHLDAAPTVDSALWAAYALHRLTEDVTQTRATYEALGRPRVEVAGLAEDVRRAIVHEYGPWCEKQSDPRWRIEAICTQPPVPVDKEAQLRRAAKGLAAAGLAPKRPVSCGDANQQGDGTYHVIGYRDGRELYVSTLGPFAGDLDDDPEARAALEAAGFRWIDAECGAVRVSGLGVYHFGSREPLDVFTLLFYWQD